MRSTASRPCRSSASARWKRPRLQPTVMQQRDEGAFVGARIRLPLQVMRIERGVVHLIGHPTPHDTQHACFGHRLSLSIWMVRLCASIPGRLTPRLCPSRPGTPPPGRACGRRVQCDWASHPAVACACLDAVVMGFCKAHATCLPAPDDHRSSLQRKAYGPRGSIEGRPRVNVAVLIGCQVVAHGHGSRRLPARIVMPPRTTRWPSTAWRCGGRDPMRHCGRAPLPGVVRGRRTPPLHRC
jgi:hypothetical protein